MLYRWKPIHGKRRRYMVSLKQHGENVIQRNLTLLYSGCSVEEAEVAAQDRTIWKCFSSQAASADNA